MDKKHLMRSQIDFQSNTVDSYSNEIATTKFLLLKDLLWNEDPTESLTTKTAHLIFPHFPTKLLPPANETLASLK